MLPFDWTISNFIRILIFLAKLRFWGFSVTGAERGCIYLLYIANCRNNWGVFL